jgi:hypothetical protein
MSELATSDFSGNQCPTNTPQPTAYGSTPLLQRRQQERVYV